MASEIEKFLSRECSETLGREVPVTLEVLDLSNLEKSPKYQRPLRNKQVEKMMEEYTPFAVGFPVVNYRPGRVRPVLMEGNHRASMLLKKGKARWPCIVTHGLSEQEESRIWEHYNKNRGQPNSEEVLKSQLIGRKPEALQLQHLVHDFGFRFAFEEGIPGKSIRAAAAMMKAFEWGIADRILRVISGSMNGDENSANAKILNGLYAFFRNREAFKKVDVEKLVEAIKESGYDSLTIVNRAMNRGVPSAIYRLVANEFKVIWNKGRRRPQEKIEHDFFEKENPRRQTRKTKGVENV